MEIGVIVTIEGDIDEKIKAVHDYGMKSCQLNCWKMELYTDEKAAEVNAACEKYGVKVSALWAGWSGPSEWNIDKEWNAYEKLYSFFRHTRQPRCV